MLSHRARWNAPLNRLAIARQNFAGELLDLTASNPTQAGLRYPLEDLAAIYERAARAPYDPQPLGLRSAREAVADLLRCSPDDVVLTASTSEAYSFLFKLLTDPGDAVVTATPSYPLLEHLAQLELVTLRPFALEHHRRWEISEARVRTAADARTRALLVVNPNNPTGSFVTSGEQDALAALGLPILSDEVFLDYPLEGAGSSFVREDVITFALGGLSKSAGLPHYKLGWIRVSGPEPQKRAAIEALELIADNFLSVSTPVQAALPYLLAVAPQIRSSIQARTRANLDLLRREISSAPAITSLPVEGGWSAILRVPRLMTDEELALALLQEGVAVQPGYFFDFEGDGWLVVSLLTPPSDFREGIRRIAQLVNRNTGVEQ